jgi:hypothetical protein
MDVKGEGVKIDSIIEKIQSIIMNTMSKGIIKYKKMENIQNIPYFYSDILFFFTRRNKKSCLI